MTSENTPEKSIAVAMKLNTILQQCSERGINVLVLNRDGSMPFDRCLIVRPDAPNFLTEEIPLP